MSILNSPQTQKEFAKLFKCMAEFFINIFRKDAGQNNLAMDRGQLKSLGDDLGFVVKGQKDLAEKFKKEGKHIESAYLNTRARVLNRMKETLDPRNIEKMAKQPANVSPENFQKIFEEEFAEVIKDDDLINGLHSVEAHRIDYDKLNELDKKIVESRFAYGSDRDKMVHTGLSAGSSVMQFQINEAIGKDYRAAVNNNKDMKLNDPVTGAERKAAKDKPERGNNIKPGVGLEETDFGMR